MRRRRRGGGPVEIRDYLNVVRRGWVIILAVTVAVAGLAAVYTFTRTPLYAWIFHVIDRWCVS